MNAVSKESIVIIGAGVAGLSAGCYAQMNGYGSQIFEMGNSPGGVCTAWKRHGYTFDGAIHWLTGTKPGSEMHAILEEIGALRGKRLITHDVFRQIVIGERRLNVYTNAERLEAEFLEAAPEDRDAIHTLVMEIQRFGRFQLPLDRRHPMLREAIRMLPFLPAVARYRRTTIEEYGRRFANPFLRKVFLTIFPIPDASVLIAILTLALFNQGDNGYPEGGSLQFSRDIERRYCELGGTVQYHSKVVKILVEDGRAVGIRLADGSEVRAQRIISAADGHSTLFEMLGAAYLDAQTVRYYQELPLFRPLLYVCLGVARDLSGEPHIVTNVLDPPAELAGERHELLGWSHYGYDPSLAPPGKSTVISMIETSYEFWEEAHQDPARYREEKRRAAQTVIAAMELRYPGIASEVEVVEVATPMTWVRYTGSWRGSYEGWLPTRPALAASMRKRIPGLRDFYQCGQWVEPGGGVPVAVISGRNVIKMICKEDRRRFVPRGQRVEGRGGGISA